MVSRCVSWLLEFFRPRAGAGGLLGDMPGSEQAAGVRGGDKVVPDADSPRLCERKTTTYAAPSWLGCVRSRHKAEGT